MLRLLINLETSKDRLNNMSSRLKELDVSFCRISAINGSKLTYVEMKEWTYPYDHFDSKVRFTRELTNGEIGCFLSHRKCWETLLLSDEKYALIMEDDIIISSKATKYMNTEKWIPDSVDICQLSCLEREVEGRISDQISSVDDHITLVQPMIPIPLGTQCYIVSRNFAKRALETSEKLPCPVDNFLFSPWFNLSKEFKIWRTAPTLVIPRPDLMSTIGKRNSYTSKKAPFIIRHGLTRTLLDWRIKLSLRGGHKFTFKFID